MNVSIAQRYQFDKLYKLQADVKRLEIEKRQLLNILKDSINAMDAAIKTLDRANQVVDGAFDLLRKYREYTLKHSSK